MEFIIMDGVNMEEIKSMFFITCFEKLEEKNFWPNLGAERVMGYYYTFEDCDEALKHNACDMFETCYHYAVVEEIEPGLYPHYKMRQFYKYDREKDGYFPIEEPKMFEHNGNLSIG